MTNLARWDRPNYRAPKTLLQHITVRWPRAMTKRPLIRAVWLTFRDLISLIFPRFFPSIYRPNRITNKKKKLKNQHLLWPNSSNLKIKKKLLSGITRSIIRRRHLFRDHEMGQSAHPRKTQFFMQRPRVLIERRRWIRRETTEIRQKSARFFSPHTQQKSFRKTQIWK